MPTPQLLLRFVPRLGSAVHVSEDALVTCRPQLLRQLSGDSTCGLVFQEIAELKMPDLNCTNVEAAMRIVEGTAKNMGVKIEAVAA